VLAATWASVVLAVVATAASGVPGLRHLSVLATRTGDGPQGVPVNKSARAAGVVDAATDPGYRLVVAAGAREVRLTRAALEAMPQRTVTLPIACVEGWSASATWTGVRLRDLVALVAAAPAAVRVESLQRSGGSRSSRVAPALVDHDDTLLALRLGAEPLDLDHGYPCRLIAPNRPGTLQTKWVARLEVES
jgi:DMSO/TMAO reductase YedYZ molybdopterin-dependent catalytic subunit